MTTNRKTVTNRLILCLAANLFLAATCAPAGGQINDMQPSELEQGEVTEHLNASLPLDLPFTASAGREVKLGEFIDGTRPVLLTLNYSNCPMLCSMQLTGLFTGLQGMQWDLGDKYRMVTVSIDPKELPERAQQTKAHYLEMYGRSGVADGWHVLVGKEENIKKLAQTVGFGYAYLPDTNEYAHAAVTMVITPAGKVSRYLYGVEYDPQTVRFSLLEAAEGKIGTTLDQIILYCFHYDADKNRYGPAAMKIMRVGGILTLVVLGGMVLVFRRRGRGKNSAPGEESSPPSAST